MNDDIIRPAAVAGTFYPDDPDELREMINGFLEAAGEVGVDGALRGLVVPHAGYIYSGPTAAFGYKLLGKFAKKTKNVIIMGPSHYAGFQGVAESGIGVWETPLGRVEAEELGPGISGGKPFIVYAEAHMSEHCLEVQLPFLQTVFGGNAFKIYPLLAGQVEPKEVADALAGMIDDKTIFIASSDLSHYNPYEKAKQIDSLANRYVPSLDINNAEKYLDACGRTAIITLMRLAEKNGWKGKFLDYRNSGDTAGDRIRVVGYGAYAFYEEK